jgi:hypothetical protein
MGSFYLEATLDGKLTENQVRRRFSEMQRQAAHENGNSYSGDWNMLPSLTFGPAQPTMAAAQEHCDTHSQKWQNAVAVRAKREVRVKEPTFRGEPDRGRQHLGIYGHYGPATSMECCVSTMNGKHERVLVAADQLTDRQKARAIKLCGEMITAVNARNAARDAFQALLAKAGNLEAKTPKASDIDKAKRKVKTTINRAETAINRYAELCLQHSKKLYGHKEEAVWYIGGHCAS